MALQQMLGVVSTLVPGVGFFFIIIIKIFRGGGEVLALSSVAPCFSSLYKL